MSVSDGDMWGALIFTDLTDEEIDVLCEASGYVDEMDGRDYFQTDREGGTVTFMGNLDALSDAINEISLDASMTVRREAAHEVSLKYHEAFTATFEGPS